MPSWVNQLVWFSPGFQSCDHRDKRHASPSLACALQETSSDEVRDALPRNHNLERACGSKSGYDSSNL
jgi:hypothetical protein